MYRGYDGAGVSYTELEVLPDFSGINTLSTGIIGGATRGPLTKTKIINAKQLRKIFGDPVEGDWGLWAALKVLKNSNLIWYKRVVSKSAKKGVSGMTGLVCKYQFKTQDYDELLNGAKVIVTLKPGTSHNETKKGEETLVKLNRHGSSEVLGLPVDVTLTRGAADEKVVPAEGYRIHSVTSVKKGTTTYELDTDYSVNLTTGVIGWVSGRGPEEGQEYVVTYVPETTETFAGDLIPLAEGQTINEIKKVYATVNGITYEYTNEVDYIVDMVPRKVVDPIAHTETIVPAGTITWIDRGDSSPVEHPTYVDASRKGDYYVLFVPETTMTVGELNRYDVVLQKNSQTLEKLTNLVIDDPDSDDYIITAMKDRSDYLTCEKNPLYPTEGPLPENLYEALNGTYTISGGDGGILGLEDADYIGEKGTDEGMQDFLDPEALDISTMIIPGVFSDAVIHAGLELAEARGDIIYIAEMPKGLTPQQADKFSRRKGDWTPTLRNGLHVIDSKFVAMYYPWILEYIPEFNRNEYTPPSAWVASQFAYNDTVAATWFAPAGFQSGTQGRGVLTSALGLEHNCNAAERDILYADDNGCVNPIVGFVGKGITIWGNRTTLRTSEWAPADSSWCQLSVRRLCNYCRKVIIKTSMETLFQPNTETYWKQWRIKVEQELQRIKEGEGIEAYRVQMDRSTISDEDIYYGRAPGKVFIKPVHAIEWIPIIFTVTHDSVTFQEGNTSVEE